MPPSRQLKQLQRLQGARVLLFAVTIFASAFLIFMVQPMVGKRIVPWFGGTPGVWSLCLAFYQSTLFLGYAYAHLLVARVPSSWQIFVHAAVFALSWAVLPVLPAESWKPTGGEDPSLHILAMLAASVALPFLLLAATGPLLQAWFFRVLPGRSPYPLYALSNIGSLLALLSYPFLIEPNLPLPVESRLWSWGFALAGGGALCCAWLAARNAGGENLAGVEPGGLDARGGAGRTLLWILLPACAVTVFMGITNELCLDVASVPFLWIVPLSIYLTTFIVCFASERFYRREVWLAVAGLMLVGVVAGQVWPDEPGSWARAASAIHFQILFYSLLLFTCCMLLHGELYRLRPSPESLTAYYLCVAGGGALGGLFVGIVAPRIFSAYDELPLGLALSWLLFLVTCWRGSTGPLRGGRLRWLRAAGVLAASGALLFLWAGSRAEPANLVLRERSFFGVLRVFVQQKWQPPRKQITLRNGTTGHGFQLIRPELRSVPTDYYAPITGVGLAMDRRPKDEPAKVGIIGLGVGTLAAYGRSGDDFKFYEIDPEVIRIARDESLFTFLSDSAAEIEVVEGDGRLSLESELRGGGGEEFDLLVLDAFNSDSIPIHLLTREAFELYVSHLAETGVLVIHVSTIHLDLTPLVFRLGAHMGMHAVAIANAPNNRYFSRGSFWVVLSRDPAYVESLVAFGRERREGAGLAKRGLRFSKPDPAVLARAPLWTDDYSDLFSVVRGGLSLGR
jgi:spermidine synthase